MNCVCLMKAFQSMGCSHSELFPSSHAQAQLYGQAAFCYEELLLHSPQSVPLHIQYADVLYTIGGPQLRTARQHYAAAAKLSGGDSLRALYGLTCTAAALAGQKVLACCIGLTYQLLSASRTGAFFFVFGPACKEGCRLLDKETLQALPRSSPSCLPFAET